MPVKVDLAVDFIGYKVVRFDIQKDKNILYMDAYGDWVTKKPGEQIKFGSSMIWDKEELESLCDELSRNGFVGRKHTIMQHDFDEIFDWFRGRILSESQQKSIQMLLDGNSILHHNKLPSSEAK